MKRGWKIFIIVLIILIALFFVFAIYICPNCFLKTEPISFESLKCDSISECEENWICVKFPELEYPICLPEENLNSYLNKSCPNGTILESDPI